MLHIAEEIDLVKSGDDYFARALAIINRSRKVVHLHVYILVNDSTGELIIEALENAVKRGVYVSVLADAFGSHSLSQDVINSMKSKGIKFKKFSPFIVHHRLHIGKRLHHKILVSDGVEAMIGGINIEDKYHVEKGPNTPWLDYAAYIKGPVCKYISYVCENIYRGKFYKVRLNSHFVQHNSNYEKGIPIKIRQNGWIRKKEGISRSLRSAVKNAHESVTIIGAYFLPGRRMRKLLKDASVRQVKVRLILQGVSDVFLTKKATQWWYAYMLRNNMEIYEWKQTVLHGKVTLIDDAWVSLGSYNINHLSDYSSIETNVETRDPIFCDTVKEEMERIIKLSTQVTYSIYHHEMNFIQQFICWVSFHTIRMLFSLHTFLISKE